MGFPTFTYTNQGEKHTFLFAKMLEIGFGLVVFFLSNAFLTLDMWKNPSLLVYLINSYFTIILLFHLGIVKIFCKPAAE